MNLKEKIALQERKIENLGIKCAKYDKNENQNVIVSKISECFSEIGLSYEETEIDRVHRIDKP